MVSLARRDIRGNAVKAVLASTISDIETSVGLDASPGAAGWPTGGALGNFTVTFERGTVREERANGTARSGLTITLNERGIDGTTAFEHVAGTDVEATFSGFEADWANLHYSDTTVDHHTQYLNLARHAAVVHTAAMLGTDSVTATQLANNAVDTNAIADSAVTTGKILDGTILPGDFNATVYGAVGSIAEINPDDAANAGVSTALARIDHQHPIIAGVPASMTKISAPTEGVSVQWPRLDHHHSMELFPWGVVADQRTTSSSGPHAADANTDLVLVATMDATRLYKAHLMTAWNISAASTWAVDLTEDGTKIARLDLTDQDRDYCSASIIFEPTGGSHTYRIFADLIVAGGTITFGGAASEPRAFWIEDIGPR